MLYVGGTTHAILFLKRIIFHAQHKKFIQICKTIVFKSLASEQGRSMIPERCKARMMALIGWLENLGRASPHGAQQNTWKEQMERKKERDQRSRDQRRECQRGKNSTQGELSDLQKGPHEDSAEHLAAYACEEPPSIEPEMMITSTSQSRKLHKTSWEWDATHRGSQLSTSELWLHSHLIK